MGKEKSAESGRSITSEQKSYLERFVTFVDWRLGVEAYNLKRVVYTVKEENQQSLSHLKHSIEGLLVLMEGFKNKVEQIRAPKENNEQDLTDVMVQLQIFVKNFNLVLHDFANANTISTAQILADLSTVIGTLTPFIRSIEYMMPAGLMASMPRSIPELEERTQALLTSYIEDTFIVDLMKQLKDFTGDMMLTDEDSINEFVNLPHSKQDLIIYAYHNANIVMKRIAIWADQIEEKLGIQKGSLLRVKKFGLDFSGNPALMGLSIQNRSLDVLFNDFKKGYEARINAMQYRANNPGRQLKKEETYPFTYAILRERVKEQEKIVNEFDEEKERDNRIDESPELRAARKAKEKNAKAYQHVIIDIGHVLEEAIRQNNLEDTKNPQEKERRAMFIQKLSQQLAAGEDVVSRTRKLMDSIRFYRKPYIEEAINKIEKSLESARETVDVQEGKRIKAVEETRVRLNKNKELLATPEANQFSDFESDTRELNENIVRLANQTYDEISSLFKLSRNHTYSLQGKQAAVSAEDSQTLLDSFKGKMQTVGDKLKLALDPEIFEAYFTRDNTQSGELPWVGEVGQAYLGANKMLEQIDAANKVIVDKEDKRPDNSPLKNINQVVEIALKGERAVGQVAWAVEGFLANTTLHQARNMLSTNQISIGKFTDLVQQDPWVVFAMGKGLESVKKLGAEEGGVNAIESAREFYAYAGKKFGHDEKSRENINNLLIMMKGVVADANAELGDESNRVDTTMYFLRHAKEYLTIIPNLTQIKNSLLMASKSEGLEMLSRLNGMLRTIFEYADAIEIAYNLKEGFITQQLLTFRDGTTFYNYLDELQTELNKSGFGFSKENVYPYRLALHKNREEKKRSVDRDLQELKGKERELLAKKESIEKSFCVDQAEHNVAMQARRVAIDDALNNIIKVSTSMRNELSEIISQYKIIQDDNDDRKLALKTKMIDLSEVLYRNIPEQLRKYNSHLSQLRLKFTDQHTIKEIEQKMARVNDEMLAQELLLNELPPGISYAASAPVNVENVQEYSLFLEQKKILASEYEKYGELLKKDRLSADVLRLQLLQAMPSMTLEEKCEMIGLQDKICGLNPEYRQVLIDLHANQVSAADLQLTQKLLEKRLQNVPKVELVNPQVAKKPILAILDAEIAQLEANRYKQYWFFTEYFCEKNLKKLDGLVYLRERYARSGYRFSDALADLRAEDGGLSTFIDDQYRHIYGEIKALDNKISDKDRGYVVVDVPPPPVEEAPILYIKTKKLLDERINVLSREMESSYFFKSTKAKKLQLLKPLLENLKEGTFKEALHKVHVKYGSMTALLFEGRTGELLKNLEEKCTTKEEKMAKMEAKIDGEIMRLKQKKGGFLLFAESRSKGIDERIAALIKFKTNDKLSKDEWAILNKHEARVVNECMALRSAVNSQAAPSL